MALLTALALPPLILVALGAVQLQAVFNDRSKAQDVADAAALWGAQQLTVTPVGVEDRAKAFAEAQLGNMTEIATVTITASVIGKNTMKIMVDTHRPSFFFNLMPAGGFYTHAEAVAEGVSQSPLCVMAFGTASGDKMEVTGESQMKAPTCLIHANARIEVGGSALLQAGTIQTGTTASGPMSPSASTGAPNIDDPFASLDIEGGGLLGCTVGAVGGLLGGVVGTVTGVLDISSTYTLPAGSHCGDIVVRNGATLDLAPGEHYFGKKLEVKEKAFLTGDNVVLIFGKDGEPKLKDGASIRIGGRKDGRLAGFVIVATRDRDKDLKIDSDSIDEMTGTVYVPKATLNIEGDGKAAQASDWTVVAAQAIKLTHKPQVQINVDYSGSDVPVPGGVGNKSPHFTALTQ